MTKKEFIETQGAILSEMIWIFRMSEKDAKDMIGKIFDIVEKVKKKK